MAEIEEKPETPLFKKIVPARGAARKAAANLKQQYTKRPRTSIAQSGNESDGQSDATDIAEDGKTVGSPSRKRTGVIALRGRGRGPGRGGANSDRTRTPVRPPRRKSLEPCGTPSFKNSSPLTSPDLKTPQKRARLSISNTPSKRAKVAASPRNVKPSSSFATTSFKSSPPSGSQAKYRDFYADGDLVWVRLNSGGDTIDPQKDFESEWYWWPAQVMGANILQVDVKLFGDDGYGAERLINVSSPSSSSILSFRYQGRIRFSRANFTLASTPPEVDPFEVQTSIEMESSDLTSRWRAALDLALTDDGDEELPEPLELLNMTMSASGKRKGKRDSASYLSEPTFTPSPNRLQKPPPVPLDEEIKVGQEDGELVLARDHKDRPDHWPARVVGLSRNKRTGNWLYEVCFMDGKKKKVERKCFFSSDEEGFATCQMGIWRTQLAASDTEGADSESELRNRGPLRSTSPNPSESDLEDVTDRTNFDELPLRDQMRYVYPFLCRTIRRRYQPSFERHDAFMKGGKAREHLAQIASLRGEFSENEVKKVSALVRKTMLRDERWAERVFDVDNMDDVQNEESRTAHASGGMKADTAMQSVTIQSSDFHAALALAGLGSSEECPVHTPSASLAVGLEAQPAAFMPPTESLTIECVANSPEPPPSAMVSIDALDQSSDMEMASNDGDHILEEVPRHSDLLKKDDEAPNVTAEVENSRNPIHTVSVSPAVNSQAPNLPQNLLEGMPSCTHAKTSTTRERPTGCAAYENLSRSERGLYCADVLLPEAVLQLHLIRAGRRSSAHLLTPEEETKLYEEGQELVQTEVHWLTQVVQMRRIAERALSKKSGKKKGAPVTMVQGGTSSRPKMIKSKY